MTNLFPYNNDKIELDKTIIIYTCALVSKLDGISFSNNKLVQVLRVLISMKFYFLFMCMKKILLGEKNLSYIQHN
jgi:hypothetical protein